MAYYKDLPDVSVLHKFGGNRFRIKEVTLRGILKVGR
jgi:hypothetical protein